MSAAADAAAPAAGEPAERVSDEGVACLEGKSRVFFFETINRRFRRTMEDAHKIIDGFLDESTTGYFAIYDGHGGRDAVELVEEEVHNETEKELRTNPGLNPIEAMKRAYKTVDDMSQQRHHLYAGTTCVSAIIRQVDGAGRVLYVANVGDSRAVLCRNRKGLRLTYDHKASDEKEAERVQEAGGFIVSNRVYGVLSVTRAVGDHAMKDVVISEPSTTETVLETSDVDSLLILACDGLWDVISDQEAVDMVQEKSMGENGEKLWKENPARELVATAIARSSTDNISVMVIYL